MPLGCPLLDELSHRHQQGEGDQHIVELDIADELRGPRGAVHGGLVSSMADCAAASAIAAASGRLVATTSLSVTFLSAGRVGPLRAIATPLRVSRQQGVAEVRVVDVGKSERIVASALVAVGFLSGGEYERKTD